MKKNIVSKAMYFSALVIAIVVTVSLITRYSNGVMPFSHVNWLLIPMFFLTIRWSERYCHIVKNRKTGIAMDLIISVMYFVAFGTFVSMVGFQSLREMKQPIMPWLTYTPWAMIAMFIFVIWIGPIKQSIFRFKD